MNTDGLVALPLYIDGLNHQPSEGGLTYSSIRDATGFELAQVKHFLVTEHVAATEFIVLACNSHGSLVAALEKTLRQLQALGDWPTETTRQAFTALRLANGEAYKL